MKMPDNPFEQPLAPQRVPNDGEPSVFVSPDRRVVPPDYVPPEVKINHRNFGLFAIADGARSSRSDAAARAAVTVAKALERHLGAALDTELDNLKKSRASEDRRPALRDQLVRDQMQLALREAHSLLFKGNQLSSNVRMRAEASVARMVDLSPSEKELFFALSGKESLYLVRDGTISHLGKQGSTVIVDDPGMLGEDDPATVIHQASLVPGDRLVLLGDGTSEVVRGSDLQDIVKQFGSKGPRAVERALQEFAKGRIEDPQNPDAKAGEISVVCWEAFPLAKKEPVHADRAVGLDVRRAELRMRLRGMAQDLDRARALSVPGPSGRELVGVKETVIRLEAEQAAAQLELFALDLSPRFKKGDVVSLAGQRQEIADVLPDGSYVAHTAGKPEDNRQKWTRWDLESSVSLDSLPIRAGDRMRVEGFITKPEDGWHVTDGMQPPGKVLFEDQGGAMHMTLPDSKVKEALRQAFTEARDAHRRLHYRRRQLEKLQKGT